MCVCLGEWLYVFLRMCVCRIQMWVLMWMASNICLCAMNSHRCISFCGVMHVITGESFETRGVWIFHRPVRARHKQKKQQNCYRLNVYDKCCRRFGNVGYVYVTRLQHASIGAEYQCVSWESFHVNRPNVLCVRHNLVFEQSVSSYSVAWGL